MKIINKDTKVYIAEDGTEFLNESDCLKYENTTLEIVKNVKYFKNYTNADLNETGMFYNHNYAAVYLSGYNSCYSEVLLQYLIDKHKGRVIHEGVQGCGVMEAFRIQNSNRNDYDKAVPNRWGGSVTGTDRIFLSDIPIDGFPKNILITGNLVKRRNQKD